MAESNHSNFNPSAPPRNLNYVENGVRNSKGPESDNGSSIDLRRSRGNIPVVRFSYSSNENKDIPSPSLPPPPQNMFRPPSNKMKKGEKKPPFYQARNYEKPVSSPESHPIANYDGIDA